jgi:two-component system, OmpR family, sensor kinase
VKHVKTPLISTGSWLKGHARMHSIVALVVFAIGLGATVYYWNNLRRSVDADMDAAFTRRVQTIGNAAGARMQLYENFLRGNGGLFVVDDFISQDDWDQYHQPYDIERTYPDVQSIGLSRYLSADEVPEYLERKAGTGDRGFTITPEGDREVYVPVSLSAPSNGSKDVAKGYDTYTNPIMRKAMERAAETGAPSISGKIELTDGDGVRHPSIVLYMPIYNKELPIATSAERRVALLGFTYAVIDVQMFIDGVLASIRNTDVALKVYDAELGPAQGVLYDSKAFATIREQEGSKVETSTIQAYDHHWGITLAASPKIISNYERQLPGQAVWRGILSSLFFAGLVWYLITDRERKYARQKQEEVQTAKDDLLSLASHQLRTPATVVKQYVGMLLQGYAGDLSPQQINMLTSAYESNERQLEIINQLLYVARLDAGRITLRRQKTDVAKLMRDVARDQSEAVAARNQQLSFKLPKRELVADIDPHYMRMVFENLLSNAIKYTPENGQLTIAVRRTPGQIVVRVSDTGVGIDPALQGNIFEKFTRVDNALSNDVNGSGVGLYLTKKIVELHKGSIDVRSVPGQGSVFIVRIPIHGPKRT